MVVVPWKLECYLDARGNNPVEEFIEALPVGDRASLRTRIDLLAEIGNRAREPLSKSWQTAEKDSYPSFALNRLATTYGLSTPPLVDLSRASPLRSF